MKQSIVSDMLTRLSEKGYRVTKQREEVLQTLAKNDKPFSLQELAAHVHIDEASVYRIIALFVREQIVEEISIKGEKSKFEITHHHHHHVVCKECGVIVHLPCMQDITPPSVASFISVDTHEVTFYGQCKACV